MMTSTIRTVCCLVPAAALALGLGILSLQASHADSSKNLPSIPSTSQASSTESNPKIDGEVVPLRDWQDTAKVTRRKRF